MTDEGPPDWDVDVAAKLVEYGTIEHLHMTENGREESWIASNAWLHRDNAV